MPTASTPDEQRRVRKLLIRTGALVKGHFVIPPDPHHYPEYVQIPVAMQHSEHARYLAVTLGRALRRARVLHQLQTSRPLTILAPQDAGIPVAFALSEALGADRTLWARQRGEQWELRRFLELTEEDQVIIVDDTLFSGATLRSVANMVRSSGAKLISAAVIVDRRQEEGPLDEDLPLVSLLHMPAERYTKDDLPAELAAQPIQEIPR